MSTKHNKFSRNKSSSLRAPTRRKKARDGSRKSSGKRRSSLAKPVGSDQAGNLKSREQPSGQAVFHLREVLNAAPIILFAIDRDGIITLSEGQGLASLGLKPGEHLGRSIFDLYRDLPNLKEKFNNALRGTLTTSIDVINDRVVESRFSVVKDEQGTITNIVGVATDISAHKEMEDALRTSDLQYHSLINSMSEGLLLVDNDDVVQFVNDQYCEMLGYSREELIGKKAFDLVLREEDRALMRERNRMRMKGVSEHYELQLIRKSGELFWVHIGAAPIMDAHSKVIGSIGVHTDISGRKKGEEYVQESERRFRQLAEHIDGVVWMSDQQKPEMLFISKAYEQIWGRPCKGLYENPRSFLEAVHPDDRVRVEAAMGSQLEGFSTDEEYRVIRPDGSMRWVRDRGFPIKDRFGHVYRIAGIAEDITGRKRVEDALRASEAQLRLITSQLPGVLWTTDQELRLTSLLGASLPHFELVPSRDIGKTLYEIFQIHDPAYLPIAAHLRALQGESVRYENKFKDRDYDVQVQPLRDGRGAIIGCMRLAFDVTDRKQVERAMQESEARFRSMADSAPVMIWIAGVEREFTYCNKGWLEFTGRTLEEELSHGWAEGIHPEDREQCYSIYVSSFEDRREFSIEYRLLRRDGIYRWVLDHGVPFFTSDGILSGYIGSCIDITERRVVEEALRTSEERYRSLVENISEIYFVVDQAGRITYCSPNMEVMTGYSSDDLLGQSYMRLIGAEDRRRVIQFYENRTDDGTIDATIEFHGRKKDGRTGWVEQSTRIIRDTQGRVIEYRNVVRDITERKSVEEQARLLAHAVESTSELICITDLDNKFTFVNKAFLEAYGYEEQEVLGRSATILPSPNNPPHVSREIFEQTRRGGWNGELLNRRKNGSEFPIHLSTSLIRDENGNVIGLMGVARDITEHKRVVEEIRGMASILEQRVLERTTEIVLQKDELGRVNEQLGQLIGQLKDAKSKAEEASKTKSQFLANVSHELRTPLNSVIGFTNVLLKNKEKHLSEQDLDYLEKVLGNGKHLLSIINQMLDLSKIETGRTDLEISTIFLEGLIQETVAELEGQVPHGVRICAEIPKQTAPFRADYGKLKQVLINLLGNAFKFTKEGTVTVNVGIDNLTARPVRIDVTDTGIGIPQEKLGDIFEAFQQVDNTSSRQYEGTGLGLTISRSLCDLMGYKLSVTSEVGRGSTFTIYLAT